MTTTQVHTITDEQIAEIEALAFKTHESTADLFAYGNAINPSKFLSLITRLREAEKDAARYQWLINQGDSTQWMNIIRLDPDDFDTINEAIDTAMQGDK